MKCPNCGCEPMAGEQHQMPGARDDRSVEMHCLIRKDNPTIPFHPVELRAIAARERPERLH